MTDDEGMTKPEDRGCLVGREAEMARSVAKTKSHVILSAAKDVTTAEGVTEVGEVPRSRSG